MQEQPRFVVIRRFFDPFEARLTYATLEAACIPVLIQNENFVNTVWTEAIAVGGVQILVPESSLAEAEALLGQSTHTLADDAADSPTASSSAPFAADTSLHSCCPACGSADIEFHVPLRRLAAALALLSLPLIPGFKRYRCRACGAVFRRHRGA
jgi:hypothetical protein